MLPVERKGTAAGLTDQLDTPAVLQQLSASSGTNAVIQSIDCSQPLTQGPLTGSCQAAAQPSRPWLGGEVAIAGVDASGNGTDRRRQEQELAEGAANSLATSAVFGACIRRWFLLPAMGIVMTCNTTKQVHDLIWRCTYNS